MDIVFKEKKFENECNSQRLLKKQYGETLPGRCHELLHNRAGQLSLDLVHPLRLIFEPANIPIPQKADGGIDWKKVTAVVIIGIDDTHD